MFNHLKVPESWNSYFSKYPNGLTIMEALVDWVGQVDLMGDHINDYTLKIDNFLLKFDENLRNEVYILISDWASSGYLQQLLLDIYGSEIKRLDIQLSTKRDKSVLLTQSDLSTSSEAHKLTMNHLSQEVKNAITGTAPVSPNIADGQVTTQKLADKSVAYSKLSKISTTLNGRGTATHDLNKRTFKLSPNSGYVVFQCLETGFNYTIQTSNAYNYTLKDSEVLVLQWDGLSSVSTTDYSALTTKHVNTPKTNEFIIAGLAWGNFVSEFGPALKLRKDLDIFFWEKGTKQFVGTTFEIGGNAVIQSALTGKFLYFTGANQSITIPDGRKLLLNWDGQTTDYAVADITAYLFTQPIETAHYEEIVLGANIANTIYTNFDVLKEKTSVSSEKANVISTTHSISELAPKFYESFLTRNKDLTVALMGDSISTNNNYNTTRTDAKNRPPLMNQFTYVSYIEEQLRWTGQEYFRYDSGNISEVATTKETLEYDLAWDWHTQENLSAANNRPGHTRVLMGSNCSVSYLFPGNAKRCDFIYRTDYLNATNATISVSGGNGIVSVFDEVTQTWKEANGFVYSAKEVDNPNEGGVQKLRKSQYQKRLKMRKTTGSPTITIANNGSGRLTYWGIQTSPHNYMIDFISIARGGHSIGRLSSFEAWDLDGIKPDLILWQMPILNERMDVCDSSFNPKDMGDNTNEAFATRFITKLNQLKNKSYAPEVVPYTMFFGAQNYSIKPDNQWSYGFATGGEAVSVETYTTQLELELRKGNHKYMNLLKLFVQNAINEGKVTDKLVGTGIEGVSWTVDGGHFNNKGAIVARDIFGSLFQE